MTWPAPACRKARTRPTRPSPVTRCPSAVSHALRTTSAAASRSSMISCRRRRPSRGRPCSSTCARTIADSSGASTSSAPWVARCTTSALDTAGSRKRASLAAAPVATNAPGASAAIRAASTPVHGNRGNGAGPVAAAGAASRGSSAENAGSARIAIRRAGRGGRVSSRRRAAAGTITISWLSISGWPPGPGIAANGTEAMPPSGTISGRGLATGRDAQAGGDDDPGSHHHRAVVTRKSRLPSAIS
jgi:hypothetical protein